MLIRRVYRVDDNRAYVSVRDYYGVVPKGQVSDSRVDDVHDFVRCGQRVSVKVIKIARARDWITLSMKQCG